MPFGDIMTAINAVEREKGADSNTFLRNVKNTYNGLKDDVHTLQESVSTSAQSIIDQY